MPRLDAHDEARLVALAHRLVDPGAARVVVWPQRAAEGFWFGGGNVIEDPSGALHLVGRYRNHGDSRTGLGAGERGVELAIFRSDDGGEHWEKTVSFDKASLDVDDRRVLSIEGSALAWTSAGVELFVSTEKTGIAYGHGLSEYLKPGTGVWTIERLAADSVTALREAEPRTVMACDDPSHAHVKDPNVWRAPGGELVLVFCTHPFCWSSSNSGYAVRGSEAGPFSSPALGFLPRGNTWDVAMTRVTCLVDVPAIGAFAGRSVTLVFYDGGECLRDLGEHDAAVRRPRGYSCEELGGIGYLVDGELHRIERLSRYLPAFVSPHGTGANRYVSVARGRGGLLATWERSQPDRSQPLLMNRLSDEAVAEVLA